MSLEYLWLLLCSLYLVTVFCLGDKSLFDLEDRDGYVEPKRPLSMKKDTQQSKKADIAASYQALVQEAKRVLAESKNLCNGKDATRKQRLNPLRFTADTNKATLLLAAKPSYSKQLLGGKFRVNDTVLNSEHVDFPGFMNWVHFQGEGDGRERVDLLLAPEDRNLGIHVDHEYALTVRFDIKFRRGLYDENVFRAGSFDKVMRGTIFELRPSEEEPTRVKVVYITLGKSFLKINSAHLNLTVCDPVYLLIQKLAYFIADECD